jgi:UDP-2,3-diacylglucosamine pyrophosphatase LpxH
MILFISDTHLGLSISKAKELCEFLQTRSPEERVYIVGDLFDHNFVHWDKWHTSALMEILKFKNIIYLPGNHDAFMRQFAGTWFYQKIILVPDRLFYEPVPGRRYLIIHGDQYDWLLHITHFMSESWFANRFRKFWGLFHNILFKYTSHFEKSLAQAAKEAHCDGVICGHSHDPLDNVFDGIHYLNIGDWLHSCSYIEEDAGKLVLKRWKSVT